MHTYFGTAALENFILLYDQPFTINEFIYVLKWTVTAAQGFKIIHTTHLHASIDNCFMVTWIAIIDHCFMVTWIVIILVSPFLS